MKHVTIYPDCPKCGNELTGQYHMMGPYDEDHPFGTGVDGHWRCDKCGYESEHKPIKPYEDPEMVKTYVEAVE